MRPEKRHAAEQIGELIDGATFLILTTFEGLNSMSMNQLRTIIRKKSCRYFVVKNRLFALAARQRGLEDLSDLLKGQVGVVFGEDDSLDTMKAVSDFGKENEALRILGGFFEGKVRTAEEMIALATMPPREVIAGELVASLQSPFSGLVHVLSDPVQSLVFVLNLLSVKKENSDSQDGN